MSAYVSDYNSIRTYFTGSQVRVDHVHHTGCHVTFRIHSTLAYSEFDTLFLLLYTLDTVYITSCMQFSQLARFMIYIIAELCSLQVVHRVVSRTRSMSLQRLRSEDSPKRANNSSRSIPTSPSPSKACTYAALY